MANSAHVPVFLETSLDTRLVVGVSSDDTVASLKRKIVAEHPMSFPVNGEIIVRAVKTCLKGIMFHLSDSMPISALLHGINETLLLYVEAVTANHERNLRNGRVDEELKVSIGGKIEDLMVLGPCHVDKEILSDHDLAEASACVLNRTEKKRRRKNKSSEDTSVRLTEFRKREDEGFEGNFVQEESGYMTSKQKREVNAQASNPDDSNLVNFLGENQSANGGRTKKEESGKGEKTYIDDGVCGDKSDKRRRRKKEKVPKPANDTSVAVSEPQNMKELAHEGGLHKEKDLPWKSLGPDFVSPQIPESANLMEPNTLNLVEHTPTEELTSNTMHTYPNEEADRLKHNAQVKGDFDFHDQPDTNQTSDQRNINQGTEENGDLTEVPNQRGVNYGIAELLEENARKDEKKKVQASEEVTQTINAVLGSVAREKKRRDKIKGSSSDVPSEVPPIREYERQVEDNIQISVEKDSHVPEKPGSTTETPNSIPSQLLKSREETEGNSTADKGIMSDNQPQNDQNAVANDMEECRKEDTSKNVLKEYAYVAGGDPGVVFGEKKKRKKSKAAFTEVLTQEPSSRENESCKEKPSNSVLEKETSKVADLTAEAVKERSRKKRKKTKASSSDMAYEVLRIGEDDSEKADDKVHKSNQIVEEQRDSDIPQKSVAVGEASEADNSVPCQLDKERRLKPEISLPTNKDIQSHNLLGIQQASTADSKEDSGKDMEVRKETAHVTGGDTGVSSPEKRRRKKKKAASIEGLGHEVAANESGQEKGNDLIFEKEIVKEAVDAGPIKIAGRDPGVVFIEKKRHKKTKAASSGGLDQKPSTEENGSCKERESNLNLGKEIIHDAENATNSGDRGVASKEKRKHKKKKAASTDVLHQELLENDAPKVGESNLMLEKEACEETDNASFRKNADDVAFPAPKSSDPEETINTIVSDILADLKKRSPVPSDDQIDVAPQMELLANVAVDQHRTEQYIGLVVETKEESSNKTETMQNTELVTGDSVIAHDEKKIHKIAKSISPMRGNEIESRDTFVLASSQKDGARNRTLDSSMVEDSVGHSKKKKRRKPEGTNSGAKVTIVGATDEANCSFKNSVPQADASGKEPQTKIQKSLKEDDALADMPSVVKKSSKGKSKEKEVTYKVSNASLAEGATQNAPNTPEKVQKSGDNFFTEIQDKASTGAVGTKGSEVLHASTTAKVNFIDYFVQQHADQPADTTSAPHKEMKGNKKIQNSFSKDSTSASIDTRVSAKNKKPIRKLQTTDKPVKSTEEHNLSETSNDKSTVRSGMGYYVSKKDDNMKHLLAGTTVDSDVSTEDEDEARSHPRRPMDAVRKVASKANGEKVDASRKTSAVFSSGGLNDVAIDASSRDESESVSRGSPMPGREKQRAMMSPSSGWKDERVADDDVPMSQESTKPKKKVNLSSVLRSSSSYKKAKISASESQAEDREMIDVVFETQPNLAS